MAAAFSSSSSSSSSKDGWNYDVFLNFRGKDIRTNFISHLHAALSSKGINTFIDNDLERGKEVSDSLLQTIEGSQIALAVFSHHYASSTYCLDELVKIWECRQSKGQFVLPIFYKVDPTDVQEVTGSYAEELAQHEVDPNTLQKWRSALVQVSNLSGEPYRDTEDLDEATFIKSIVKKVSDKLDRELLHVADHPIALDSHIQCIESILDVESSDDVLMVGIWGMGGIGKTTLAKVIYNKFAHQFEASCFLPNVRERSSECDGFAKLQETILFDTIGYESPLMGNFVKGISLIKKRLKNKRIFIVFDDVDHKDQLNKLVGGLNWFYKGSRIIITTRDEHLLSVHGVKVEYKLSELHDRDALELFSWNAFKKSQPDEDYVELSQCIVKYAQGLPLALNVLGSSLLNRDKSQWEDVLSTLKQYPHKDITNILKVSYDGLENELHKKIFLDIACFFKGWDRDVIIDILSEFGPRLGVTILVERSLIYVDEKNRILMHDLVQIMGRDIARCSNNGAGGRRLCFKEDILPVLLGNEGMHQDIEGIMLDLFDKEKIEIDPKIFSKMTQLKVLILGNANPHAKAPKQFLSYLLSWSGFIMFWALEFLPLQLVQYIGQLLQAIISMILLVEAKWSYWTITSKMKFNNLIVMDFNRCEFLYHTPSFSTMPNLKQLRFFYCLNLEKIDKSITCLEKLQQLNFSGCYSLRSFPNFSKSRVNQDMKDLKRMTLSWCLSLKEIPDLSGIPNLQILDLTGCSRLEKIDESVGFFENLFYFSLEFCENLCSCPNLVRLRSLRTFHLNYCSKLEKFPTTMETIKGVSKLELIRTAIEEIPSSIEHFTRLQQLIIEECRNLVRISNTIYKLQHLKEFKISNCPKLRKFPRGYSPSINWLFPRLERLAVRGCNLEECEFLSTPENFPMLWSLDISGNNIVYIPRSISGLTKLIELKVNSCKQLVEIPQLPPCLKTLDAGNCDSLERRRTRRRG